MCSASCPANADQCREFRTIEEHVARVASVVPGLTHTSASARALMASPRPACWWPTPIILPASSASRMRSRVVFMRSHPACDRPQQLRLLLDSLANYERRFRVPAMSSCSMIQSRKPIVIQPRSASRIRPRGRQSASATSVSRTHKAAPAPGQALPQAASSPNGCSIAARAPGAAVADAHGTLPCCFRRSHVCDAR